MIEITIGRLQDNTIVLEDQSVSRHHCRCFEENGRYFIEDLKSLNGVIVDGKKIKETKDFTSASEISIGKCKFTGEELIESIRRCEVTAVERCEAIEQKYRKMAERYANNVRLLLNAAHIDIYPYTPVFPSDEDKVSFMVKEYEHKMQESLDMLQLISRASQMDSLTFHDDIETFSAIIRDAKELQKGKCMEIRQHIMDIVGEMQKNTQEQVMNAFAALAAYYKKTFSEFYETCLPDNQKWQDIKNKRIISLPFLLTEYKDYEYPFFVQRINVRQLIFAPFLKQKNLLIRHTANEAETADMLVNGVIGRLLAASQSGNIQLHMVDMKDLGGTSNMLKMLDRHVFSICARSTDTQTLLSALDGHVENVVQNLLQGAYTSLDMFNRGKEKQEPYQVVVLRNFPFGITPESAHTIQRIMVNGVRSGVHFVFMLNNDYVNGMEDCRKVYNIMRLENAESVNAIEVNLTVHNDDYHVREHYDSLDESVMHNVVQYVNAGFEMKKDEILRLTDYMIPKEEWWSRFSANRIDIPFGMSTNKQIQKINITQESGQNAAVVIGIPGSGKSVFLHVLIASAMVNYSPKELQMYLLDFSGVEFDVYARHKLPHARVIAPEAEREFGLSIIREVYEEGVRRGNLCRDCGVTNIVELKQKYSDVVVPRLLVIIDEFQKLFEVENDKISQEANKKIHAIIQEYRKFGINLILATQKLPAKSVVPYDLIANRVVFKSDPNDFSNLLRWSHSMPQPRLLTGNCVYNNESGSELSNYVTRSFFINASNELENLLDEVAQFADDHPEMVDEHELRIFRNKELPDFMDRILSDRHMENKDIPREVGIYLGESIAIAPCHVYAPLTNDSNNNILIIGGEPNVAKGIAYYSLISEIICHTMNSCSVLKMNFTMDDDPIRDVFQGDIYKSAAGFCNMLDADTSEDVLDLLQMIKNNVIDNRKNNPAEDRNHVFLNIFEFQRGRMFDFTGGRGDMQSECSRLLEYIIKNGPMLGVYTILQVDNLANLSKLGYNIQNQFNHRIALQMSEKDSDKIVGNSSANRLRVDNKPATINRALYFNEVNNTITKFKPYKLFEQNGKNKD